MLHRKGRSIEYCRSDTTTAPVAAAATSAVAVDVVKDLATDFGRQARHRLELVARGVEDRLGRTEVTDQQSFARRADARQVVEHRRRHSLVAPLAVKRDRKAVRLIADALQN